MILRWGCDGEIGHDEIMLFLCQRYVVPCISKQEVDMERNEELVKAVVTAAHAEGERTVLSCAQAFELAEQFDVAVIEIGRICNERGIRFYKCQLGCF